jgi:hypothetical protein
MHHPDHLSLGTFVCICREQSYTGSDMRACQRSGEPNIADAAGCGCERRT